LSPAGGSPVRVAARRPGSRLAASGGKRPASKPSVESPARGSKAAVRSITRSLRHLVGLYVDIPEEDDSTGTALVTIDETDAAAPLVYAHVTV
jgi:hypothetical protein